MRRIRLLLAGVATLTLAPLAPAAAQDDSSRLPPAGFGTLRQDDIDLSLGDDALDIRFTPLDEQVIRLLAPDGYRALAALVASRRADIDSVGREYGVSRPGLALVSFFGRQPNVRFDPQLILLSSRNRQFRPIGVVPLSPRFTGQQLNVRERANAIYLFEEEIPVNEPFTVSYGRLSSSEWERILETLERERARVAARARVRH